MDDEGPERRLSDDDAARLTGQVADLAGAGLPLAPGLRAAGEEMGRGRLRAALFALARSIEGGATVEDALAAQGPRLPAHLRGLIAVGSRTGKIGQVLGRFIAYSQVGTEMRRGLWLSLAYPVVALAISTLILSFLASTIVPSFEAIFKDFGISLPRVTILLLEVSHGVAMTRLTGIEVLVALVALGLLFFLVLDRAARRSFLGGLPLVGFLWRDASLAEFCHLLALLLESEVPLGEALRLTGKGVDDLAIDRACAAMGRDVEGGMTLAEAMALRKVIPAGLPRLIRWAEKTQALPESLHMAGEMFEAGARVQTGLAGTIFVVVTITLILLSVGLVVIGLFLPLITLISKLSG